MAGNLLYKASNGHLIHNSGGHLVFRNPFTPGTDSPFCGVSGNTPAQFRITGTLPSSSVCIAIGGNSTQVVGVNTTINIVISQTSASVWDSGFVAVAGTRNDYFGTTVCGGPPAFTNSLEYQVKLTRVDATTWRLTITYRATAGASFDSWNITVTGLPSGDCITPVSFSGPSSTGGGAWGTGNFLATPV